MRFACIVIAREAISLGIGTKDEDADVEWVSFACWFRDDTRSSV